MTAIPTASPGVAFFNEFDRKIEELGRLSGNDPKRIEWAVRNSTTHRKLIGELYFLERDFVVRLADRRYLAHVPIWFIKRYHAYKERFAPEVDRVYGNLWLRAFGLGDDEKVDGISVAEILHPKRTPPAPADDEDGIAGWYTVGAGDSAEAVDFVIQYVWNMHEGHDHAEDLRTGLDAWEWFTGTVGVDLAGIEGRWNKLPRALIPSHVSAADGLLDLLDDATKAYVYGLSAAAVAMCRAVCERVLKESYFGDDKKNESLGDLAYLAEKRFDHLRQSNLGKHVTVANRVMHHYRARQFSEREDESVRQFLETVKTLIERAPEKPQRGRC